MIPYLCLQQVGIGVRGLICGDARDLPALLLEKADHVLSANTFHGAPEKAAMARAVAAVLRPGGRLVIVN